MTKNNATETSNSFHGHVCVDGMPHDTNGDHVDNKNKKDNDIDDDDKMEHDDGKKPTTAATKTFTKRQVGGAAAVGGIVGLIVAGPVIAIAAGIGVAVAATTKGKVGDVARASGDVVASAGERLKQLDKKHQVSETTSKVIVKGCKTVSKTLKPKDAPTSSTQTGGAKA
ncbi:hypothetical protein MHU86_20627 [Fragilaria crotonensis]|nr:hypothetical protein MHU86_20627 [Fragilaria crotonensis]